MWCLGTWFSDGFGSVRFTAGLDDLKSLLQPKLFYDSVYARCIYIAKLVITLGINRAVFFPENWMLPNRKEKIECDKPIIHCKYL